MLIFINDNKTEKPPEGGITYSKQIRHQNQLLKSSYYCSNLFFAVHHNTFEVFF